MADRVEVLLEKLKTTDHGVIKNSVIEELGSIGDHRAIKPLIELLDDADAMVRWRVIKTIGLYGRDAMPQLLQRLQSESPHIRRNAVQALAEIGGEEVKDLLIRMLMFDESDNNVLVEVIRALHKLHPQRAVDPLITVLKANDWEMKWRAIHTLGRIGDPKAIEPLLEMMEDPDPDIRWAANVAVDNIKQVGMNGGPETAAKEKPAPPLLEKPSARQQPPSDLALSASAPVGAVKVHVNGDLTAQNAREFKGFVQGVISTSADPLEIDLSQCNFIDSFSLSTLNNIRKTLKQKRRTLRLSGLNPNLKTVFEATRLDSLFEIIE